MNKKRLLLFGFAAVMLFFSCNLDESLDKLESVNKVQWDPTIAAPLIDTRLTISDFLDRASSAFIEVDDENLIHVVYRGDLASLKAKQIAGIPTQNFNGQFGLLQFHVDQFNNTGSTTVEFSTIFNFGPDNMEIDSLTMNACAVSTTLSHDLQHDVDIEISLPNVIQENGQPFVINSSLPYSGSSNTSKNITRDLKNAFFDLTKSGNKLYSQLPANFKITINQSGGNPITTSDMFSFNTDFLYNEYDVLYGFIGNKVISPSDLDSIELDLFRGVDSNLQNINFRIADPRLKFYMSNSYGIPIAAQISEITTISRSAGKLSATGFPDPLVIPTPNRQQIGETLVDSFELNRTNSNVADMISNIPQHLIYGFGAEVNPVGTTSRNFITYNSEFKISVDIDVPLAGRADGFELTQETDISDMTKDLNDLEDIDQLEEILVRMFIRNEFPVDVDLQLYFQDSSGNTLDSLFQEGQMLLRSASVDGNGRVTNSNDYPLDITMTREQFDIIKTATKGLITAKLNTLKQNGNQPEVRFYADYGIGFKLGMQAKASIKVDVE